MRLSDRLAATVPARACDRDSVDARIQAALAEAHTRWPGVDVDETRLVEWLAARLDPSAPSVEDALDQLRLPDLILACACAGGDARALAAFDATFLAHDGRISDDIKQQLRVRLFVGDAPRITSYGGRGALGAWVKTIATRIAIDAARVEHELPTEDALLEAIDVDASRGPIRDVLKAEARTIMQTAMRESLATLTPLERTLLLQYYIDGVGVTELGKLHGLDASNISRRLAKARLALLAHVKRVLLRNNQLADSQLDSIVDLVRSQLSVTGGLRG